VSTEQTKPQYKREHFKFETIPQRLKKEILEQFETVKAKKNKDDFDLMFIQAVKQKMKQVRMKLVVTHTTSGLKKEWVIDSKDAEIDHNRYMAEVADLVRLTRTARKKEIKRLAKNFDGASYETVGGVFVKSNLINEIGSRCTINDPFMAKNPRKPKVNYIGVELEFNKIAGQTTQTIGAALKKANLARYVHVGEDGSCGGIDARGNRMRGFEVRVLLEENNFQDTLEKICKVIKDLGFKTDATCGTHVHLDMRNRDVKRSYANLFSVQLLLRKFLTYDRKHNIYCMKNEFATFDEHTEHATGRESRRCGINTQSYYKYKTIEIRMHQGTLEVSKLAPFIKLLLKVVNFNGSINKTVHTLKQAKDILQVDGTLFNDLSELMKHRGA
jgi:hypothetical protein